METPESDGNLTIDWKFYELSIGKLNKHTHTQWLKNRTAKSVADDIIHVFYDLKILPA